jgi:hypothetical protein
MQPVAVPVLQRFLYKRSPNFSFYFVPDIFHPKAIWWHGYGAYIGSANLTKSAWSGNIEAGVFFTEEELSEHNLRDTLTEFFLEVHRRSHPLTQELMLEVDRFTFKDRLQAEMEGAKKRFEADRIIPRLKSLISIDKTPASQQRREDFLKEWNSTIQTLRLIATRVMLYRPVWIEPTVQSGTQADLFLHAYYYEQVRNGVSYPFREFYKRNCENPEAVLIAAMEWWQSLAVAPGSEANMVHEQLPLLQQRLHETTVLQLSREEFADGKRSVNPIWRTGIGFEKNWGCKRMQASRTSLGGNAGAGNRLWSWCGSLKIAG